MSYLNFFFLIIPSFVVPKIKIWRRPLKEAQGNTDLFPSSSPLASPRPLSASSRRPQSASSQRPQSASYLLRNPSAASISRYHVSITCSTLSLTLSPLALSLSLPDCHSVSSCFNFSPNFTLLSFSLLSLFSSSLSHI